jgi:hypothetical protein
MMELLAGLLVAGAALAFILEPLTHPAVTKPDGVQHALRDPGVLVEAMRSRLTTACPACRTVSPPGHAFCVRCGRVLLS